MSANTYRVKTDMSAALFSNDGRKKRTLNFSKAVFIYLLGGLVGTVWETLWNFMNGNGFVFCNGSLFTPFNFVYGVGGLVIILCLRNRTKVWHVYLIGMIGGGIVEYMLSYLEELILGTRSWDYSGRLLNIFGRTTFIYMMFWGLLCVVVIFFLYRPLDALLEMYPERAMKIISVVMVCIVAVDLTVTVGAMMRYAARNKGITAATAIGRLFDRFCDDAFMARRFPAMRFK
ncbi:MAG: putative ABC transporter permease [Clostridia bacterium]|nr:putative ABC transporter permease [Clostridia bacterium]